MYGRGGGRDHQALAAVCGKLPLESKECEAAWKRHRFTVRWDRVGRDIDTFQFEAPKDD
jgi:signal peptidase I